MIEYQTLTMYYRATDKSAAQAGVAMTSVLDGAGWQTQIGVYPSYPPSQSAANPSQPNFIAPIGTAPSWGGRAANVPGTAVGATVTSTSPDFLLSGLSIAYRQTAIGFG